jgi:sugar diacid utilization regulator
MYTSAMIMHWLENNIIRSHVTKDGDPSYTGGIIIIDPDRSVLHAEDLYIGRADLVFHLIKTTALPVKCTIICSGDEPELTDEIIPAGFTVIFTRMDVIPLYNKLQNRIHAFFRWEQNLQKALGSDSIQSIAEVSASFMRDASVTILNAGYKALASSSSPEIKDRDVAEISQNGYLSYESVQELMHTDKYRHDREKDRIYFRSKSGYDVIVYPIRFKNTVVARFCVTSAEPSLDSYLEELGAIACEYVSQFLLSSRGTEYNINAGFSTLVSDLIECRLTDQDELQERLKLLPLAYRKYYHVVVVAFPSLTNDPNEELFSARKPENQKESIPWNYIIGRLEQIFPFSNSTVYHDQIIMLVRKDKYRERMQVPLEQLTELLAGYDAYAAIGNYSKFLTALPPLYHQTRLTLHLGIALRSNPQQRVFFYEDFSIYQFIEMTASQIQQKYRTSNMVYLCHPALISLLRFDKKNKTNLTEVLYVYLKNERNATLTARQLFIHRNTMLYKINKIEELTGEDLNNPTLRERLLLSYHILEYIEKYMKEDVLFLKRNPPDPKSSS